MFKMTEENSIAFANDNKIPLLSNLTDQNSFNEDQSACHLIINPIENSTVPYNSSANLAQQKYLKSTNYNERDDQVPPSNRQLFNCSRPSTICYQTFKNDTNSPFNTPLKRSKTFTGVFGSIFNKQTDSLKTYLENDSFKKLNGLTYSKSNYDYNDKFASSEPLPNEFNNRLALSSSTNFLPNLIDVQNIKQNLVSMAVVMTKHQFSNTGRILTQQQSNQIQNQNLDSKKRSIEIPNSLSNSSTSTSVSSSSYINNDGSTVALQDLNSFNLNFCALCLQYIESNKFVILKGCKCGFCKSCLEQYCTIVIREHLLTSSQITCPSSDCPNSNSYLMPEQIEELVNKDTFKLYEKIKLDFEVHLDYPNRVWCPRANCETVCVVSSTELNNLKNLEENYLNKNLNEQKVSRRVPVKCSKCNLTFCLHCRNDYHGSMPCQSQSEDESLSLVLSRARTPNSLNECIKKCPQCGIYIEKDKGCGQMMCQKCKHVFCWFCLSSLEEDFLLRHYDSGACKNKLGHSKAVLLWLRFQVIAVFLGFALFLLLVSPILLISAPMLLMAHYCCNLSIRTKIWTKDDYLDESQNNLQNTNKPTNTTANDNQSIQTDQLIDLNASDHQGNLEINRISSPEPSKHQQLIQAYIQNNGNHKLVSESSNSLNKFEEHPIKLSGYDTIVEEKKKSFFSSLFSWFSRNDKPDPTIPKLSSLLDIEKHQKFIEELMADRLSLDNQMNAADLDKHFVIVSTSDVDNQNDLKGNEKKLRWWRWNSDMKRDIDLV